MKLKAHVFRACALAGFFLTPSAYAYDLDPFTFAGLPQHCQAFFAAHDAKLGQDPRAFHIDTYRKSIGTAWESMNRYCPALAQLVKLENYQIKHLDDDGKRLRLSQILDGFEYQLSRSDWNKGNSWFHAEVLKNRGRVMSLMGDSDKSIENYKKAIDIYQAYLPAYWDLATVYVELEDYSAATRVLNDALAHAKNKKARTHFENEIDRLSDLASDAK